MQRPWEGTGAVGSVPLLYISGAFLPAALSTPWRVACHSSPVHVPLPDPESPLHPQSRVPHYWGIQFVWSDLSWVPVLGVISSDWGEWEPGDRPKIRVWRRNTAGSS